MSSEDYLDDIELAEQEAGITELLDIGYQQLDRYVEWSETVLKLDSRTSQQDAFNAETMIDYLANNHRKSVFDMNEFELRWFVFSHYIRKAMADVETEERLLSSLTRFLGSLSHELVVTDWMRAVLDDATFYNKRRASYRALSEEDEREWKKGFAEWCLELEDDLDSRCLLLPSALSAGLSWADQKGWREATLYDEANAQWQRERDELLLDGMNFEQIRDQLNISFLEWVDTPQDKLEGLSPGEVIVAERLETADPEEDDEEE